jgi:hypothetical protein
MSLVAALLTMKVHRGVSRFTRRGRRTRAAVLSLEALLARPGRDLRAIYGKVLVGKQPSLLGLVDHTLEKRLRHIGVEQPLSVLRERRRIPHRVVHLESDEPAKQQIVVELSHEQPLASDRVENLQQQPRRSFSGAIDGRPTCAYIRSNRNESSFSASSTRVRIGRSGWSAAIRRSADT